MMNQNDLIDAIKHYIKIPKCYYSAVLINAPWGAGKTYFVKNVLYTEVKKELQNANKYMIYISLNGINSVDLLCSRFNLAKLKLSNKPKNKNNIAYDSLNVISAFSDLLSEENQKKINAALKITGSMVKISKKLVMSFKGEEIIFILDDLERSTIPIEELLGCVSDIAEQEGCKFILIGNEEKIKDQDKYYEIKEKIIGHTYLFKQDVQSIINNELKDKELKDYEGKIIDMLNNEENINYRVLFQSLETYKELKGVIEKIQFDYFKNKDNRTKFLFELLCSCYHTKKVLMEQKKKGNSTVEDSCIEMAKNLINQGKMKFEFVNTICREGFYDETNIENEINEYIKQEDLSKKEKMLYRLRQEYYLMEDDEIEERFNEIIGKIKLNSMNVILYPQVLAVYYKLQDVDFFQDDSILSEILKTMEENISKVESHTDLKMLKYYDGVPEKYKEKFAENMKRLIKAQDNKLSEKKIILYDNNDKWVQFIKDTYQSNSDMYMQKKAFLKYIDTNSLLEKIFNDKNKIIEDFREFITEIGRNYIFENDKETVKIIIEKLNNHILSSKKSRIKNLQLNWLINSLKSYVGGNDN